MGERPPSLAEKAFNTMKKMVVKAKPKVCTDIELDITANDYIVK